MSGTWAGRLAVLAAISGLALAACGGRNDHTTATDQTPHGGTASVDCHALAAPAASAPTDPQATASTQSGRLGPAAQAVGALGRGQFKSSYTGLAVDPARDALVVYRMPEPAFDAAARQSAGDVQVVFCDTTRTKMELDPLAGQIASDNSQGQHGFTVYAVVVTPDGYLTVGADKPDIARPYLQSTYGPAVGEVVQGQPSTNQ
ncbi:hypothetical protein ACNTMW_25060 [Planosporangium sp. 12N6]|uniref:hypothetical protein n=1 Tax=Planosporangium spinosum TaxID=3402278 RepID=UPI003CF7D9D7